MILLSSFYPSSGDELSSFLFFIHFHYLDVRSARRPPLNKNSRDISVRSEEQGWRVA